MSKQKYKDQNKKNYTRNIIVLFVMIFILFIALVILGKIQKKQLAPKVSYDSLSTVKEVIEYYESKYISENESEDGSFYLDIYLTFKVLPYDEDDNSNEKYYTDLLTDVAKVIRYKSYRLFDKENDLNIKVICKNGEIVSIIINDIEDYFIYMDSQISMKKYKEIETTNLEITSDLLHTCIDNNWNADNNFGSRESIFNEYYIYFDEGIEVKSIQNKVYNIVFTTRYNGDVISNIHPGMKLSSIKEILGEPTFEEDGVDVIGYKSNQIYAFFTESEISIYRIPNIDNIRDFLELVDIYLTDENSDLLGFMNELTYIWPDYSEYKYDQDYVFISYPHKGIEIKVNYDDTNGILVYNNIKGKISDITPYLNKTDFVARLQIDSVYEAEKRRVKYESELKNKCDDYINSLPEDKKNKIGESILYNFFPEIDSNGRIYSMKFISNTNEFPNRELNDGVDSYVWVSRNGFVYSKRGKGIYFYNLDNGNVNKLIDGEKEFNIIEYKDNKLRFDDEEIILE